MKAQIARVNPSTIQPIGMDISRPTTGNSEQSRSGQIDPILRTMGGNGSVPGSVLVVWGSVFGAGGGGIARAAVGNDCDPPIQRTGCCARVEMRHDGQGHVSIGCNGGSAPPPVARFASPE